MSSEKKKLRRTKELAHYRTHYFETIIKVAIRSWMGNIVSRNGFSNTQRML